MEFIGGCFECSDEWCGIGFAVDEFFLCEIANHTDGAAEFFGEFFYGQFGKVFDFGEWSFFRTNAIDAAVANTWAVEFPRQGLVTEVGGHVGFVLDDAVIYIEQVDGTIGRVVEVDGAETFVGGC